MRIEQKRHWASPGIFSSHKYLLMALLILLLLLMLTGGR